MPDMFPNIKTASLTLSAANTISFGEFDVGLNIFDKVALLISRIEYELSTAAIEEMTTAGDDIQAALVNSNSLTTLASDQVEVIDRVAIHRVDLGTAGTGVIRRDVYEHDFSTLPGGGILIPPRPLFFAGNSNGLASAATFRFRVYFIIHRLTDAQYLELLETRNAFG